MNNKFKRILAHFCAFLDKYKAIFELIVIIMELVSVLLVHNTLVEMRIERHNSYRPTICIPETEYAVQYTFEYENPDDALYPKHFDTMPVFYVEDLVQEQYPPLYLDLVNIGVGSAQDVHISISRESCIKAIEQFNTASEYCKMQYGDRASSVHYADYIDYGSKSALHHSKVGCDDSCFEPRCSLHENSEDCDENCDYMDSEHSCTSPLDDHWSLLYFDDAFYAPYILPNAEQSYKFPLPTIYYCLINAMRIEAENVFIDDFYVMIPDIELTIEYTDVQGVKYELPAIIHTESGSLTAGFFSLTVSIKILNQ